MMSKRNYITISPRRKIENFNNFETRAKRQFHVFYTKYKTFYACEVRKEVLRIFAILAPSGRKIVAKSKDISLCHLRVLTTRMKIKLWLNLTDTISLIYQNDKLAVLESISIYYITLGSKFTFSNFSYS